MAAAAIGNTFSDILGIGSSYYVEQMVIKLGLKPPNLTPKQLDMNCSRRAANLVRLKNVLNNQICYFFDILNIVEKLKIKIIIQINFRKLIL